MPGNSQQKQEPGPPLGSRHPRIRRVRNPRKISHPNVTEHRLSAPSLGTDTRRKRPINPVLRRAQLWLQVVVGDPKTPPWLRGGPGTGANHCRLYPHQSLPHKDCAIIALGRCSPALGAWNALDTEPGPEAGVLIRDFRANTSPEPSMATDPMIWRYSYRWKAALIWKRRLWGPPGRFTE